MIKNSEFAYYPLSFAETSEINRRNIKVYKVKGKVFATHNAKENRCCIKLSLIDQPLFCMIDPQIIYEVPNKYGKFGWTLINLKLVSEELLIEALTAAYCNVAPAKLKAPYLQSIESF
jgi:hypothetical protein